MDISKISKRKEKTLEQTRADMNKFAKNQDAKAIFMLTSRGLVSHLEPTANLFELIGYLRINLRTYEDEILNRHSAKSKESDFQPNGGQNYIG